MRMPFSFSLGARLLRGKMGTARYVRGSILGIAVSLVPLIVVMEVSGGMIDGITSRLVEMSTYHLRVSLPPDTSPAALKADTDAVAASRGVTEVIPERQGVGLLFSRGKSAGVTVRFIPPGLFQEDQGLRKMITVDEGTAALPAGDSLLLGAALAGSLGVHAGDRVFLLTPYGADAMGPPRITPMTVSGVLSTGYQEIEKLYAYAPLDSSWSILSNMASSTAIGAKVADPYGDLGPTVSDIRERLPDFGRVSTWEELNNARLRSFQTTKALLILIMALIVVVGCVNVSSAVIMIAIERRMDVGILKAAGVPPGSLTLAFVSAGFMTGLAGTAAGTAVGLFLAVNVNQLISVIQGAVNLAIKVFSAVRSSIIPAAPSAASVTIFNTAYYLSTIPIRIQWQEVCAAACGTLLLSGLASYLPAAKAARTRPLDVIRKV